MFPELYVPMFPRLEEFAGAWAMEPTYFAAMWEAIGRMDLTAHIRQQSEAPAPAPRSAVEMIQARGGKSIAFVPVMGTLMKQRSSMGGTSTIQLRRDIRQAAADPNVSAILLGIESPGGATAGLYDLAADVQAAGKQKPVWSHIDDLTASAAYWIASQTSRIVANSPTAFVGSIGTIMTVYDQSGAAEQQGIKAMVFATGPLKGAGVPGSQVTPEQAAYFQGIVDGMQQHFDAAVRKGRGLTKAELETVRTGGVWKATDAQDLKLIDGIQPLSKTIDQLAAAAGQSGRTPNAAVLPMVRHTLPTVA